MRRTLPFAISHRRFAKFVTSYPEDDAHPMNSLKMSSTAKSISEKMLIFFSHRKVFNKTFYEFTQKNNKKIITTMKQRLIKYEWDTKYLNIFSVKPKIINITILPCSCQGSNLIFPPCLHNFHFLPPPYSFISQTSFIVTI